MRAHASEIAKDEVFLEVVDLFLFAHLAGADLRLVLNTPDRMAVLSPANLTEGILPPGVFLPRPAEHAVKRAVVLTRADYSPSSLPAEFNHFLPCWPAGSVTAWEETEVVKQRAQMSRLAILSKVAEADNEQVAEALSQQLDMMDATTAALLSLLRRLHMEAQLLARDVPADVLTLVTM